MKIHIASDHAGFEHKEELKKYLTYKKFEVIDYGANIFDVTDDYPDFITPCAQGVLDSLDGLVAQSRLNNFLQDAGIDKNVRPEDLSLTQFASLNNFLSSGI